MENAKLCLVASDGFFLNLAAVMHQLSYEIKLDEVDSHYPFHQQSRIFEDILNKRKLKLTQKRANFGFDNLKMNLDVILGRDAISQQSTGF